MAVKGLRSEAAHLNLVQSLRMNGTAPPLSHMLFTSIHSDIPSKTVYTSVISHRSPF
jgi:hypothetical protein